MNGVPDKSQPSHDDDEQIRKLWRAAGGNFHGPHVETGTMPEAKLLPFLRSLFREGQNSAAPSAKNALGPAPRWVTSWPNWHGIPGNTEVVPSSDYDALLTTHLELVGQFNGAIKLLQEANEVCRSASSIAEREGKDTGWDSFQYRLRKVLEAQHVALYPSAPTDGGSANG